MCGSSTRARAARAAASCRPNSKAIAKARDAETKAGTSPALRAAMSKPVPVGDSAVPRLRRAAPEGTGRARLGRRRDRHSRSVRSNSVERNGRLNETVRSLHRRGGRARQGARLPIVSLFEMNLLPQTQGADRPHGGTSSLTADDAAGALPDSGGCARDERRHARPRCRNDSRSRTSRRRLRVERHPSHFVRTRRSFATADPDPELKEILSASPIVSRTFSREDTLTLVCRGLRQLEPRRLARVLFETTVQ